MAITLKEFVKEMENNVIIDFNTGIIKFVHKQGIFATSNPDLLLRVYEAFKNKKKFRVNKDELD